MLTMKFLFSTTINDYNRNYNVIIIDYDYAITITIMPKSATNAWSSAWVFDNWLKKHGYVTSRVSIKLK